MQLESTLMLVNILKVQAGIGWQIMEFHVSFTFTSALGVCQRGNTILRDLDPSIDFWTLRDCSRLFLLQSLLSTFCFVFCWDTSLMVKGLEGKSGPPHRSVPATTSSQPTQLELMRYLTNLSRLTPYFGFGFFNQKWSGVLNLILI